jgi:hypothetical protein
VERIVKFYMNEQEQAFLQERFPKLWENLKDNIELYEPYERDEQMSRINKQMEDKLGALAVEYGYRVATHPEVPGVRMLGVRPSTVYIDEAHHTSSVFTPGRSDVTPQEWLEHRRICGRNLLECLSGEAH